MAIRFIECRRVRNSTGSVYSHCDPTMDCIFNEVNFRTEIAWCYKGPGNVTKHFKRKHDTVLLYAKSKNSVFNWDDVRVPYGTVALNRRRYAEGNERPLWTLSWSNCILVRRNTSTRLRQLDNLLTILRGIMFPEHKSFPPVR